MICGIESVPSAAVWLLFLHVFDSLDSLFSYLHCAYLKAEMDLKSDAWEQASLTFLGLLPIILAHTHLQSWMDAERQEPPPPQRALKLEEGIQGVFHPCPLHDCWSGFGVTEVLSSNFGSAILFTFRISLGTDLFSLNLNLLSMKRK